MTEIKNEILDTPLKAGDYHITTETPEGPKPVELSPDDKAQVEQKLHDYHWDRARMTVETDLQTERAQEQLRRQQKEQEEQLQEQRDEIAADEARALDNQALASALLGERGGMQQARQKEIRRTAAKNQRLVNEAQKKLAKETARAIDQLRADGEFEKADAMLDLNQNLERGLHDILTRVAEGLLEPEEVEPTVRTMTAPQQEAAPAQPGAAPSRPAVSGNGGPIFERLQNLGTVAEEALRRGAERPADALGYLMELMDAGKIEDTDVDYIYCGLLQGSIPTSYQEFVDMTDWSGILTEEAFLRDKKVNRNYLGYQDYLIRMYIQHG